MSFLTHKEFLFYKRWHDQSGVVQFGRRCFAFAEVDFSLLVLRLFLCDLVVALVVDTVNRAVLRVLLSFDACVPPELPLLLEVHPLLFKELLPRLLWRAGAREFDLPLALELALGETLFLLVERALLLLPLDGAADHGDPAAHFVRGVRVCEERVPCAHHGEAVGDRLVDPEVVRDRGELREGVDDLAERRDLVHLVLGLLDVLLVVVDEDAPRVQHCPMLLERLEERGEVAVVEPARPNHFVARELGGLYGRRKLGHEKKRGFTKSKGIKVDMNISAGAAMGAIVRDIRG